MDPNYRCLIAFFTCVLLSSFAVSANENWYQDTAGIMGTNIVVEVWADDERQGKQAIDTVFDEMERINQLMSPYIESSELTRINQKAGKRAVAISDEMFSLLETAQSFSELTQGAFDVTFASVGYLYDYRKGLKPDEKQLATLTEAIDYRWIELNSTDKTIKFLHPNVKVDLGGIAKGHAVDNAIALLRQMGIKHALVTAGGDTKLLGDRRGREWLVGIRDPRDATKQAVMLPLSNTAMSTSGDYERYFEQDGERYHHILSPQTGRSVDGVQSVSIISDSSTHNDALSTAVFVLGVEQGLALINKVPDTDAIILDADRKMHFSQGLVQQSTTH